MIKIKSILTSITGDVDQIGSERYFVTITCFIASVFLMCLCVIHVFMHLSLPPVFIAGGTSLVILVLYFLVRFGSCLFYPKLILSVIGLVMLDLTWYTKFLSIGPVLFFILIFGALVLWVWEGKSLALLLIMYYLNIALLFIIEYRADDSLLVYPDDRVRSVDIYLSFTLYSIILIFLLFIVKQDFIRKKERAIKSDKLKSAFLANMSHEIRTPMNAIVGFSNLIKDGVNPELNAKYIDIIQNSSESLMRLINDIVDLSKIETGDLVIKNSNFNIRDLFLELKGLYIIELQKKQKTGIHLTFELPEGDLMVHSDFARLKQVLSNLLNNAVKFTSKGDISFNCLHEGEELIFSVSDSGTGIPEEDRDKIFNRFTSFNYEGMNTGGSGIGLSIVEEIINILDGRIWLKSNYGEGSVFFFAIPFNAPGKTTKSSKETEAMKLPPEADIQPAILLVEDDQDSLELLMQILKPLNIKIDSVSDGNEAVRYAKMNPQTSLILMDLKLPFLDGYEATKAIKKMNPNIPIIAQTAYAMVGDREKALASGCDEYLPKPIESGTLIRLIQAYLPS